MAYKVHVKCKPRKDDKTATNIGINEYFPLFEHGFHNISQNKNTFMQ